MNYITKISNKLFLPTPTNAPAKNPLQYRILLAIGIGLLVSLACWRALSKFELGASDFTWAMRAAQDLLNGRNPYNYPFGRYDIPYPLPAALVGLPFSWFALSVGAALFFGSSSALLAFGLTRYSYIRLLVFMAYPFFAALITAQWSPLIMAGAFFPFLMPLVLIKPQISLPVSLTHLTWGGIFITLGVGILSLIVMPAWPIVWYSQIGPYQNFIPLLLFPGPLLLLALFKRRDRDSWLLLVAAILPQRWFYDNLILWLIPKTRRELLATAVISWGAGIWRWYIMPEAIEQVGRVSVVFLYLPMLAIILLRNKKPEIGG